MVNASVDPDLLAGSTIVHINSQEEWEIFQEAMIARGAHHHEQDFDEHMPFRWIEREGQRLEWYKGRFESTQKGAYRNYTLLDFSDLLLPPSNLRSDFDEMFTG